MVSVLVHRSPEFLSLSAHGQPWKVRYTYTIEIEPSSNLLNPAKSTRTINKLQSLPYPAFSPAQNMYCQESIKIKRKFCYLYENVLKWGPWWGYKATYSTENRFISQNHPADRQLFLRNVGKIVMTYPKFILLFNTEQKNLLCIIGFMIVCEENLSIHTKSKMRWHTLSFSPIHRAISLFTIKSLRMSHYRPFIHSVSVLQWVNVTIPERLILSLYLT